MSIITFFNQKGGVGKTTCSVLLIDYLVKQGQKVLAVDLDPQASLSETFIEFEEETPTILNYFNRSNILKDCIIKVNSTMDLLPAHEEISYLPSVDSAYLDKMKLNFMPIFQNYDYVVIDTHPSIDWMSRLAMKLSNYIFMPSTMAYYSYNALNRALIEIDLMKTPDFKDCFVFENKKLNSKRKNKTDFRVLFSEKLGNMFLRDIYLVDAITIEDRTSFGENFFDLKTPRKQEVLEFFESLMELVR